MFYFLSKHRWFNGSSSVFFLMSEVNIYVYILTYWHVFGGSEYNKFIQRAFVGCTYVQLQYHTLWTNENISSGESRWCSSVSVGLVLVSSWSWRWVRIISRDPSIASFLAVFRNFAQVLVLIPRWVLISSFVLIQAPVEPITRGLFNGRILACHVGGPGSIPGQCIFLFIL